MRAGGERRLERGEAAFSELRRHRERGVEIVARVRVRPVEAVGREAADHADQLAVIGRRLRIAELHVVARVPELAPLDEERFGAGERRRLHGPAQLHFVAPRAPEERRRAAAGLPAPQVVAGEIDRRLAERLADRERRPDRALHALVNARQVGGIGAENRRREVVAKRRLDRLDRLVGPGLDRHRLAPALDAGVVGEPHDDRRPRPGLEELELPDERVVEAAGFDADDLAHSRQAGVADTADLTIRLTSLASRTARCQ